MRSYRNATYLIYFQNFIIIGFTQVKSKARLKIELEIEIEIKSEISTEIKLKKHRYQQTIQNNLKTGFLNGALFFCILLAPENI